MAPGSRFLTCNILATSTSVLICPLKVHSILFSACPFFFGSRRPVRSVSSEKSWTGSKLDSSNALSIEFTSRFVEYVILGRIDMILAHRFLHEGYLFLYCLYHYLHVHYRSFHQNRYHHLA